MELISVIVPVYNDQNNISRCVDSIISQTYANLEIILIDDGSSDKTGDICDQYAKKDGRVRVIHKQNEGLRAAIITGVNDITGDYIVFCDSDDWLCEDIAERLYETLMAQNTDGVRCGFLRHEFGTVSKEEAPVSRVYSKQEIESEILNPFFEETGSITSSWSNSRCGKIYKTELFKKALAGCNPKLAMGEDIEVNLRYLALCGSVYILSGYHGYCYNSHAGSMTHSYYPELTDRYLLLGAELRRLAAEQKRRGIALNTLMDASWCEVFFRVIASGETLFNKRKRIIRIISNLSNTGEIENRIIEYKSYVRWSIKIMLRRLVFMGLIMYGVIQRAAKLLNR